MTWDLAKAIEHAEAERSVQRHNCVTIDADDFALIIAAAKTQVIIEPRYVDVFEVRCKVYRGEAPDSGYSMHVAVRFHLETADGLAARWRADKRRTCIEVRPVKHRVE